MAEILTVDPKDVQDNKVMAILAYFGILVFIPLFAAKESPFARFHTNQGLILLIANVSYSIAVWIISIILIMISPSLALVVSLLYLASLLLLILMIIGIINAAKGEMKELPIIGKYRILN
jgi:uncharacterized membrane protein